MKGAKMTDKKLPAKKSSRAVTKKQSGALKGQGIQTHAKALSKELGGQVELLTKEHKKRDTAEERKKVIHLKLKILRSLKAHVDGVSDLACWAFEPR